MLLLSTVFVGGLGAAQGRVPVMALLPPSHSKTSCTLFQGMRCNGQHSDPLHTPPTPGSPRPPHRSLPPPQVVREASRRVLGLRPFESQLIGGMILNDGQIAEMRTGEGKTLVAVLPSYLNALVGKGVHVVTVNDYLARRDSECVGQVPR